MATKNTTKKTQVKTKAPIKAKAKTPVKKTVVASAKRLPKRAPSKKATTERPFMTMQANRETAYWVVLGIVVVTFGIWINGLQTDIQKIYDQIDASVANEPVQMVTKKQ